MISFNQALAIIASAAKPLGTEQVSLDMPPAGFWHLTVIAIDFAARRGFGDG